MAAGRLGVALLGAGRLGAAHARTLASLPEVHLAVVADPAPAARELGARYGARAVADAREAILDREVEAVVIVTPTGAHAAQIEAAAHARKAPACGPSAVPMAETLSTSEPVTKRATSRSWMVMSTNWPPQVGM